MFTDQGPAFDPIGLPNDPLSDYIPPGLDSAQNSVTPAPAISTAQSFWDTIKQDSQSALAWTETEASDLGSGAKSAVVAGYDNVKSAVGTVVSDVSNPIGNVLDNVYWKIIIAVVVLGGAIYFIGKGGAVKVNAIV